MDFVKNITRKMNEVFETDVNSFDKKLIDIAKSSGGKAYLVGGAVRDNIIGLEAKDRDYVITKITLEDLAKKLQKNIPEGKINEVGKSFGIIKISIGNDEFDIAIPRADIDRTDVKTDPNIPIESDLLRRDLTCNSLAQDLETGEIINPPGYDGVSDIKNKILRATGNPQERFKEDPLRILRIIQFASRFGFEIEPNTLLGIKENIDLLKDVSPERFYDEFYKGWTKGLANTQKFFELLFDTNIGMMLFGSEFEPIILNKNNSDMNSNEFFLAQYIAAFLNGGNYTIMDKKIDDQDFIKVAKWFKNSKNSINFDTIKEISKHGDKFEFILKVFNLFDIKDLYNSMKVIVSKPLITRQDSNKPLNAWELPITGGQLMEIAEKLNIPLKGKAISETILNLIKAYQNNTIKLFKTEEENIKEIEQFLKTTILKENYVECYNRIEIIRKRINNIYNK